MPRRTTVQFVDVAEQLLALREALSSPLQVCVERVKTGETATQDLIVGNSFFPPPLENTINPHSFAPLKPRVVQIRVMDHFSNFGDRFIRNGKAPGEGFK